MKEISASKPHAIVVTFNPELSVLSSELVILASQVEQIWLVDNASFIPLTILVESLNLSGKLRLIQLAANLGLGAAQNVGIRHACSAGASHVLILDQDSLPMPDMVKHLLTGSAQLQASGVPLAAVAPVYADSETGPVSGFVRLGWLGFKKQAVSSGQNLVEAHFLISSGSLFDVSVLEDIGPMDESLFIDHVDTEWCLRAQSKGYKLFGVPSARMVHHLGNTRKRIWFLRWRNVPYHSPFRYYYIFRNSVLLQRRSYIPFKWRVAEFIRCCRMVCFYGLFAPQRGACLKMMFRGIADGLRGVSGPIKS